jgi:ribosomal protein L11 methyltransferase
MQYIKVTFPAAEQSDRDLLTALLSDLGYDGFEETEGELLAYIEEDTYDADALDSLPGVGGVFQTEIIPSQNWNEVWESNFPPVVVDDFCTIRAHFHDLKISTPYEIVITPKMSFGTGHHATTCLMIRLMRDLDFNGKQVLDFGSGTGVLAILAEKLGAGDVLAIDNDAWPVENAIENTERNNCTHIKVQLASLEDINPAPVDIVLANINRHILLKFLPALFDLLNKGGILLLSGILNDDAEVMTQAAASAGFLNINIKEQSGWLAVHLIKP